ncbi:peptidase inhibitor family I36 protein [Streptomyces qinzhouensis]|nr:peptidase inhibitor family I36 protein [Streptomyces qinzhouensis]
MTVKSARPPRRIRRPAMLLSALALAAASVAVTAPAQASAPDAAAVALPAPSAGDTRAAVTALDAGQRSQLQSEIDQQLAATTGGVQISANEISYNGGEPIMVFPLPGAATAPASSGAALTAEGVDPAVIQEITVEGCPAGDWDNRWYCFYQHPDFGGRRLQWNYEHCNGVNFGQYDFRNRASGWVNTTIPNHPARLYVRVYDTDPAPDDYLWTGNPGAKDAHVGAANNDKADLFRACRS